MGIGVLAGIGIGVWMLMRFGLRDMFLGFVCTVILAAWVAAVVLG